MREEGRPPQGDQPSGVGQLPSSAQPSAQSQQGAVGFNPYVDPKRPSRRAHAKKATPVRGPEGSSPAGRPPRSPRRTLSNVLIALGVVLLVVAAGVFGYAQLRYHQQDEVNGELAARAGVTDAASETAGPQVDWAALKAVNDDVVGWVQMPGTDINYPVYQGESNDTYLRTNAYGEYSIGGQIFMDYENAAPGLLDRQTLIYGHHLNNGAMFAPVDDMTDQQTFDAHDTVWYATEDATYELEPLFIYRGDAYDATARQISFSSEDELHTYLQERLALAVAQSPDAADAVTRVSRVLTLVTCDYESGFGRGNGRGLLVCALKSEVSPSDETEGSA